MMMSVTAPVLEGSLTDAYLDPAVENALERGEDVMTSDIFD